MPNNTFDFSRALAIIKGGGVVTRLCWRDTGMTVGVVVPQPVDEKPNLMTPFLALHAPNGLMMAWVPNSHEMFASDWLEVAQEVSGHA